ncbi:MULTISPECIES: methyltransferase family protein [Chryseobacterium]|uniref:Isoprenylcysteine carboxylmethyltransferase family protein n=1 Tax=Chryseobacterium pennae TaxID=2258962 RepID=A0A3D9CCN1_9FLAO|nr:MULTISPECIES: isoprenylcysteine carboxylmethyltransferase family protein [Chryseobacterium]MCS4302665.1 protein-S-isoprenylcysteine O-methyltransferase Ste14 [Chryseobacterium sp. BIGb0232]REC63663.1 isoprenylcysteine carboxylmethyltransferase family protein [Chryseobacterium pennae]ROS17319.1 protein-S-isoprenylcysteine O-methyltransferase Ste14 [Chryseobacterium nakagawai]
MTDFIRFFIPIYFILFFLVSFLGISIAVAKKIGKNPNVLPKDDSAYALVGLYFKLVLMGLFMYTSLLLLFPDIIMDAFKISVLDSDVFQYIGIALMIFSFIWVIVAQLYMKDSWRIGIDDKLKTKLITNGVFSFSRNPVFLGMTVSLIGFFLLLPTMISLIFFLTGNILIQVQIRLEEDHLLKQHGETYETYKKRVGRMLSLY